MAKIRIEFDTDNDAFVDDFDNECRRVLSRARFRIQVQALSYENEPLPKEPSSRAELCDSNGNTIGFVEYTP